MLKDYYKILELPPQATLGEIKKNFRRLALRYHPDTNQGNRYAEAWYREVQEAYQTLTDDAMRDEYHQQRWLLKSQGRAFAPIMPLTPPFILRQALELREQVRTMDHFRMSHQLLQEQTLLVLQDENIEALVSFNDSTINRQFLQVIIESLEPLEHPLLKPIFVQLGKLVSLDRISQNLLKNYQTQCKRRFIWSKYQAWIYLLVTLVLCGLIYWVGLK